MIYVNAVGMLNALGTSPEDIAANLGRGIAPGMKAREGWLQSGQPCMTGGVDADLPDIPAHLAPHRSRNNQLLLAALAQLQEPLDAMIDEFGPTRIGIILGTSTSGLDEADRYVSSIESTGSSGDHHYFRQELGDPSRFLAAHLQLAGPAYTISTACSSSARAILAGKRLIEAGLIDAAIVGGADTLSRMPVNGFNSLEALSDRLCQPFARERNGITIGEGACLCLISKQPANIALCGGGESSDAYHMSAPDPEGTGAEQAIRRALADARLQPGDIGYINLHGTGTPLNDAMEAKVIQRIFGNQVPCSSTKHLTGHMLGAAGAGEFGLCWLILHNRLPLPPQSFSDCHPDESLPESGLLTRPTSIRKPYMLSNSFAFGGNNCALVLGVATHEIC